MDDTYGAVCDHGRLARKCELCSATQKKMTGPYYARLPAGTVLRQRREQKRRIRIIGTIGHGFHTMVWVWIRGNGQRDRRYLSCCTKGLLRTEWVIVEAAFVMREE